jgi:hypothetical protein
LRSALRLVDVMHLLKQFFHPAIEHKLKQMSSVERDKMVAYHKVIYQVFARKIQPLIALVKRLTTLYETCMLLVGAEHMNTLTAEGTDTYIDSFHTNESLLNSIFSNHWFQIIIKKKELTPNVVRSFNFLDLVLYAKEHHVIQQT